MKEIAEKLAVSLTTHHFTLTTAESCTGGGVAWTLTQLPGCSAWFDRGYVTYHNQAKIDNLGVPETTLSEYGAVSMQVAAEMAEGALLNSYADVAISVTGIAGPTGGSPEKPIGSVWFGVAVLNHSTVTCHQQFSGDRRAIQTQAIQFALTYTLEHLTQVIHTLESDVT